MRRGQRGIRHLSRQAWEHHAYVPIASALVANTSQAFSSSRLLRQQGQNARPLTRTNLIPILDERPFLQVEGMILPQGGAKHLADF